MGFVSTEQTTEIIESVARVVEASNPEVVSPAMPNHWWALWIATAPVVIVPLFLWGKKALYKRKNP
jgi:hypothetical protein